MRPVVVVGGYTPGLAVIRALGPHAVPVVLARYDRRDMGQASKWAHEVVTCPHPEHRESSFVDFLVQLAQRYPGAMVVPASDQALAAIATNAGRLARAGYVVAAPSEWAARTCLNKSDTYALAAASAVPSPVTTVINGVSDIERYGARAHFPAVLKPTLSHRYYAVFGRKWTRVDSLEHAVAEYQRAEKAGLDVILQELIPGDELCGANYNAYFWGGQALVEMTAAKIRNSPAETGSPSVVLSRELPDVLGPGRRMLRALDFHGFANIEFKLDPRDGLYKIIEVNARHNLSAMLAYRCGVNFALLQYRHLLYGEHPAQPDCQQGMYWIDITRDLKDAMSYLRRGDYSLARFLRPYRAPHVCAVWDASDPGPARVRAWDSMKALATLPCGSLTTRSSIRGGGSSLGGGRLGGRPADPNQTGVRPPSSNDLRAAPLAARSLGGGDSRPPWVGRTEHADAAPTDRSRDTQLPDDLRVSLTAHPDPARLAAWDRLIASTANSDVAQLSAWAAIRRLAGYEPLYMLVSSGSELLGGAALLRRRVRALGWIAYLPYGPVLAQGPTTTRAAVRQRLVTALAEVARTHAALFVQPPQDGEDITVDLLRCGFRFSDAGIAPAATLRVDLSLSEDRLRANLSRRLRTWTRQWAARGVTVRVGDQRDIPVLADLAASTASYQGFPPVQREYLDTLYAQLAPGGHVVLLLGELAGKPVAAELLSGCGQVLKSRITGLDRSNAQAGKLNVASALIWEAIRWGKTNGYRYFDLGGIRPESVRALRGSGPVDPAMLARPDRFKTQFGGEVLIYPQAVELITSRAIRIGYDLLHRGSGGQKLLSMLREALRGAR